MIPAEYFRIRESVHGSLCFNNVFPSSSVILRLAFRSHTSIGSFWHFRLQLLSVMSWHFSLKLLYGELTRVPQEAGRVQGWESVC